MDTTLIVNPGSSSKKYALYKGGTEIFSVLFEKTENGFAQCVEVNNVRQACEGVTAGKYDDALVFALEQARTLGVLDSYARIQRVGMRIVAPGTFFTVHRTIDTAYVRNLTALRDAAPLHIPHQLSELTLLRNILPHARAVGVSDSAFHATMPPHARRYSLPKKDAEAYDLYRFGYHGLSLSSVVRQLGGEMGRVPERIIVCHIGSGVSVTAIKDGRSIDTTMGFAPTSGLMMGARAGEVDPSAFTYLFRRQGNDMDRTERAVSEDGGIKGMLGSGDLRIALDRASRGDHEAVVAVNMFVHGIRKAIGAMSAVLGGMDMLVLTGTAPERNPYVRALVTTDLAFLGITIDEEKNEKLGERAGIFSDFTGVTARVIHTDEQYEIAAIATVL